VIARGFGGAHVGADRNVHPDEPGRCRQDRAGDEAGGAKPAEEEEDHRSDDHADDGDGGVLAAKVGAGAFLDRACDLDHPGVARRRTKDLLAGEDAVKHRQAATGHGNKKQVHGVILTPWIEKGESGRFGRRPEKPGVV